MQRRLDIERLDQKLLMTGEPTGLFGDSAQLVADLNPAAVKPTIILGAQIEDDYMVVVNDGGGNYELWLTDGTESELLGEYAANLPSATGSRVSCQETPGHEVLQVIGDRAYLQLDFHPRAPFDGFDQGESQLWTATAEPGSPQELVRLGPVCDFVDYGHQFEERDGALLLRMSTWFNGDTNSGQVFISDGTDEGTERVGRGLSVPFSATIQELVRLGDDWYFLGANSSRVEEFWLYRVDVESDELVKLKQFAGSIHTSGVSPSGLIERDGLLYFFADLGEGDGRQFWQSDGTPEGTVPNDNPDLWREPDRVPSHANRFRPSFLPYLGASISADENQLIMDVDGQPEVIFTVPSTASRGSDPIELVVDPDGLFFISGELEKLYRISDGEATEFPDDDFEANASTRLELVGNTLFVFSENELRRYNAVTGELEFTLGGISRAATTSSDDAVFFLHGAELWRADANEVRIDLLGEINRISTDTTPLIEYSDGKIYYTDGRQGLRVFNVETGEAFGLPSNVQAIGTGGDDELIAIRRSTLNFGQLEILKGDGNATEFELVTRTMRAQLASSQTASFGDELFFGDTDGNLWKTDGTPDGTDIVFAFPKPLDSQAQANDVVLNLVSGKDAVYFTANGGENGTELWVSDGTQEGTQLAVDVRPGPDSSSPSELTIVGDMLYFVANDGVRGREIWSIDLHQEQETLPGDTNEDGKVDFEDFLILSSNFGQKTTNGFAEGDFDRDGVVQFADFLLLSDNFGKWLLG